MADLPIDPPPPPPDPPMCEIAPPPPYTPALVIFNEPLERTGS